MLAPNETSEARWMSKVLVCGSIALDLIGQYSGSFGDYQEKYEVSALNISLQLSELRTSFGGCGMNITYGLHAMGVDVLPLTSAGKNYSDQYEGYLQSLGIDTRYICVDDSFSQCATAFIVSDLEGNQITAFHPGASVSSTRLLPSEIPEMKDVELAVLAPEDAPIMLRQARDLAKLNIPMLFDPGQGLAEFKQEEIRELVELSDYVITNQHEWEILQQNSGLDLDAVTAGVKELIVTHGQRGSTIYSHHNETFETQVGPVRVNTILDPTGCGDAFRAGYVAGLVRGYPSRLCAEIGSVLAAYNLESMQTQNYQFSLTEFADRFHGAWGFYPFESN